MTDLILMRRHFHQWQFRTIPPSAEGRKIMYCIFLNIDSYPQTMPTPFQSSRMKNQSLPRCFIFDLSEVFIAGLPGVEKCVSRRLSLPEDGLLECFAGDPLIQVLEGRISEDSYRLPPRISAIQQTSGSKVQRLNGDRDIVSRLCR